MASREQPVYVPEAFEMGDAELEQLLLHAGAGDLVTMGPTGLQATLLPFVYDAAVGPRGVLRGHLARNNEQWQSTPLGEALVILRVPDAYVSPSWYATKREHGRVVPTWNYVTAHVHGELLGGVPAAYVEGQLRAIVGVEVLITRVQAKAKLSQNRPDHDVAGVIDGLRGSGEERMAAQVEAHRADREQ